MTPNRLRPLTALLLAAGISTVSAQEREIAPLPSLADLVARTAPAVVSIAITEAVAQPTSRGDRELLPLPGDDYYGGPPERGEGAGSGVIVDTESGYVLTNHHVVETASLIRVTLNDERSFDARVIGSDPLADLAVLQIEADGLTALPFAPAQDLLVGDYVVAIGNPFGIGQTVTSGIVSALGRTGGFIENNQAFEDFIQTDASINPGNSGGALINLRGELVGINSAIISTGFGGGNVGIGFAIPNEMILSVMGRLLEFGEVRRGMLGVYMRSLTPSLAADLGFGTSSGALVLEVSPDSAGERAGLEIYDIIVGIDGERVTASNALRNRIAMKLPGEAVELAIVRDETERTVRAVLDARDIDADRRLDSNALPPPGPLDGIRLLTDSDQRQGVTVRGIARGSLADNADVRPGDLIIAINQQPVGSIDDAMLLASQTWTVVLEIQRGEQRLLRVLR